MSVSRAARRQVSAAVIALAGAIVALAMILGAAPASASVHPEQGPAAVAQLPMPEPVSAPVAVPAEPMAMPPGDTLELRTGVGAVVGAVIGGLAGLPFFIVGAIPGAIIGGLIGAGIGAAGWHIANQYSS